MKIDRLILDNFLTYDHLDYRFESRPLLVQGINLTDEKQLTNGTGKSGLQTGIEFAITASNSRGVRDEELITYGKEDSNVELYASCDVRKETIHIKWKLRLKGSNKVAISIDRGEGFVTESLANVNDSKDFIQKWFDISKEDLFNYFIINKTRFKSFFKSSNKDKVELINRFSDSKVIDGVEKIDTKDLESKIISIESKIDIRDSDLGNIAVDLSYEENRDFEEETKEEVNKLKDIIFNYNEDNIELEEDTKFQLKEIDINQNKINERKVEILDLEQDIKDIIKSSNVISKEVNEASLIVGKIFKRETNFKLTDWSNERTTFNKLISDLEYDLDFAVNEENGFLDKKSTVLDLLQKVNNVLSGAITCPKCSHEFSLKGDLQLEKDKKVKLLELDHGYECKVDESKELQRLLKIDIKEVDVDLSKINKKEELENAEKYKITNELNKAKDILRDLKHDLNVKDIDIKALENYILGINQTIDRRLIDISAAKASIKYNDKSIQQNKNSITSTEDKIGDVRVGNSKETILSLRKKMKLIRQEIKQLEKDFDKKKEVLAEEQMWSLNFKQFKTYLANQSLEVMGYHCNRYLKDMRSDLRVRFEGYKVLASGKLKEEITATVIRERERTFNSFSGGEQGRMLFASILANRHLINDNHKYGGLDFLSIDEIFEGVDSVGLRSLLDSAKDLSIPVMIITHINSDELDGDVLTIEKKNGISKIK